MATVPTALPGTVLRVIATNDLGATFVPYRTSWGTSGSCAAVAALLEQELEHQPTLWLDAGDLTVGPTAALLGRRPWPEVAALPIAAAAAGNHDFDDGAPALQEAARALPFPLLCANADAGLPGSAVLDTGAGPVGVIGLTHPAAHEFTSAPVVATSAQRMRHLASSLRADGARWVVALLHDGVTWWPQEGGIGTRPDRLVAAVRPWADAVDLVLGGHTLGAWSGDVAGTPVGHGHPFASSVLVVDVPAPPARAVVRGVVPVVGRRPGAPDAATEALDAAASRVVAHSSRTWLSRAGARHYLPDLVASALRSATGAQAALVPAGQHGTQAPLDGAVAALLAGPVTALDLHRLFPGEEDHPVVVHLARGELRTVLGALDAAADPTDRAHDDAWWNWCRMPPALAGPDEATSVAVMPAHAARVTRPLDRAVTTEPTGVSAREALARALQPAPR